MICLARPPKRVKVRRLDDARRALASNEDVLRLADVMAGQFASRYPYIGDEFQGVAYTAVVQAARRFDPGLGVKFSTYAHGRIEGAMLDALRKQVPKGYARRKDVPKVTVMSDPSLCAERLAVGTNLDALCELMDHEAARGKDTYWQDRLPDEPDEPVKVAEKVEVEPVFSQGLLF